MGFGCDNLESFNYSNFNDDICYVTALGRVPATGAVAMYRIPMVAPDAGTFPLGQMFSGDREKQDGYNTFGKVNASSQGNETVTDNTMSISLRADTVYNAINPEVLPPTVNRNSAMAFLEGSGIDDNGTYVELISTSGARNVCPLDITDAKYLFYKDGYFVIDGKKHDSTTGIPSLRSNPYIDKYNKTNICTSMELAIAPTAETTDDIVFRWAFVSSSNVQFAEGTDANNYTADCMFLADRRHVSQLMYDGFSANEVDTVAISGTESIYKVNADYIITITGGGTPSVGGTIGDVAIVIDDADDTVEIFKYATTWVDAPVTSTLGKGFVAWTSEIATDLNGTGGTTGEVGFIVVETAGTTGSAIAGAFGTGNYVIPAKDAITNDIDRTVFWENYTV